MKLEELRDMVRQEFGPGLEHASPANVQEFLANFYAGVTRKREGRYNITEDRTSYEEIVKEFLMGVLEHPSDDMIVLLWLLALELFFAVIEPIEKEKIGRFLNDLQEDV